MYCLCFSRTVLVSAEVGASVLVVLMGFLCRGRGQAPPLRTLAQSSGALVRRGGPRGRPHQRIVDTIYRLFSSRLASRFSFQKLSRSRFAGELVVLDDDLPAGEHRLDLTGDFSPLVGVVVDSHVKRPGG